MQTKDNCIYFLLIEPSFEFELFLETARNFLTQFCQESFVLPEFWIVGCFKIWRGLLFHFTSQN